MRGSHVISQLLDLALKLMEGLYENYNTMNCAVCR
jgi:hypothetical protein